MLIGVYVKGEAMPEKRKFRYIAELCEGDRLAILDDGRILIANPTRRPRVINPDGTISYLDDRELVEN
jgi:hypothetical protein